MEVEGRHHIRKRLMDTIIIDSALEEDIKQLLTEVPAPVRAYFASGKVEVVAKNLMQKYKLHVDQGAITEREIILLLLGLKDPSEFTQTLSTEASIDQQTINGIVQDINQQIFVPLREEMRKGGTIEQLTKPAIAPAPPQPAAASVPKYAPPPPPRPPISNPSIAPLPPKFVMPIRPGASVAKRSLINLIQKPMDFADKLLEDHEEPHIEFNKTSPVAGPAETPLGQALRRVLPRPPEASGVVGPPENLPGAIFHSELSKPPVPPSIPPKPYTIDPYHEPLDEK